MKKKLALLALVLVLQLTWILATAITHEYGLATGKSILLETRPVDPRDLLRGDFVILNYAVSDIPFENFNSPVISAVTPGRRIYVALKPDGEFYRVSRASLDPIGDLAPDEVLLCGTSAVNWSGASSIRVEYGLEKYFVPEGRGNPRGKLTVEVAVSPSGSGRIKQVFVDGVPYLKAVPSPAIQ